MSDPELAPTRWPEARAPRGMVATPHFLASQSGVAALRAGGNAIDAAVAAAATIAVVYPHMNGIGGDNFWLIWDAGRQRLLALNAAGRAAAAADLDTYRARFGTALPTRGGVAALTVPGAVSGWWEAHRLSRDVMGSRVTWPALLAAAIEHAAEGFEPSPCQRRMTDAATALFAGDGPEEVRRTLWPIFHPDAL